MPTTTRTAAQRKPVPVTDEALGHKPPQNLEAEVAVLCALLIDRDAFIVVSELLHPESFYDPRHQKIYAAILALAMRQQPVDVLTVCEQLKQDGTYDEVGGRNYIIDLSNAISTSANVLQHAHYIVEKYTARELISYAGNVSTKALDEGQDIDQLMQEAEGRLFELSQKNMRQDYQQIDPIIDQARQAIEKAAQGTGGVTGVGTGYHDLDKITAGWQDSDLIIIAGRPAMGKTSFALSLAKNIAVDQKLPVAFFSLEMNNVQLVNRLISNVCSIPGNKILNGQLTDDEWKRFDGNIGQLMGSPLYVDDTPGLSVFELRTKARRLVKERGVRLIMIDYLQLMNANGIKFSNRQEEVSTISRSLKGLAKELNIPVIALSQLSRDVEKRANANGTGDDDKRPQLSDLRESGAIEQDADMVLFVHRPEYYHKYQDANGNNLKGMAYIIIAKHRKGATADVTLAFKGQYTRFANPDEQDPYAPAAEGGGTMRASGLNADFDADNDNPLGGGMMTNDMPY